MLSTNTINRQFSVAPMMDLTDRHCRVFHRLLAPSALLYTEMVTTGAVLHGDRERLLGFDDTEHPLSLQLGGSDPDDLASCAKVAEEWGYDEVNLNVGCPSDRVQKGRFGAILMREPELVRDCIRAMQDAVSIPVTVKTRLGVDELDSYDYFLQFIDRVAESGCREFIVHARKAWLEGLSPKQNRDVPPLHPGRVYRLKQERPELNVSINGGIASLAECRQHLEKVDGVMLGRAAYQTPQLLSELEQDFTGRKPLPEAELIRLMQDYIEAQQQRGVPLKHITRHMLGLFQGQPGSRAWRRCLSENAHLPGSDASLLDQAVAAMREAAPAPREERRAAISGGKA